MKDTLKGAYIISELKMLAGPIGELLTDGERLTSFIKLAQKLPDLIEIIEQTKKEEMNRIEKEMIEYGFEEGDVKHFINGLNNINSND